MPRGRDAVAALRRPIVGGIAAADLAQAVHPLRVLLTRRPHEPDFLFFRDLPQKEGLFVDVGAHAGHSSASLHLARPRFRILAFEPNPAMWPSLTLTRAWLGRRFRFRRCGLSDATREADFHLPHAGGAPLHGEGSFHPDALADPITRRRLATLAAGRPLRVVTRPRPLIRLDDLGLSPDVVKLDVQGAEASALRGMRETLARHRPILLIENNHEARAIADWLAALDYHPFVYHGGRLRRVENPFQGLNAFFVAPPRLAALGWLVE